MPTSVDGRREADKKFGYIYPCVTFPLSDLTMEVPTVRQDACEIIVRSKDVQNRRQIEQDDQKRKHLKKCFFFQYSPKGYCYYAWERKESETIKSSLRIRLPVYRIRHSLCCKTTVEWTDASKNFRSYKIQSYALVWNLYFPSGHRQEPKLPQILLLRRLLVQ